MPVNGNQVNGNPDPSDRDAPTLRLITVESLERTLALVSLLTDTKEAVRLAAAEGIAELSTDHLGMAQREVFDGCRDRNPEVRAAMVRAAGRMAPRSEEATTLLGLALADDDSSVRRAAAEAANKVVPDFTPMVWPLMRHCAEPDRLEETAWLGSNCALWKSGECEYDGDPSPVSDDHIAAACRTILFDPSSEWVEVCVGRVLEHLSNGSPSQSETLARAIAPALGLAIAGPRWDELGMATKAAVAKLVRHIGKTGSILIGPLVQRAENDGINVWMEALLSVVKVDPELYPPFVPTLRLLLGDERAQHQSLAIGLTKALLMRVSGPEHGCIVDMLSDAYDGVSHQNRRSIVEAIGKSTPEVALPWLVDMYGRTEARDVRASIEQTIGAVRSTAHWQKQPRLDQAIEPLARRLSSTERRRLGL